MAWRMAVLSVRLFSLCESSARFTCADSSAASAASFRLSLFAADDHETQLTSDALVLQRVDERVQADVEISQEHRRVVADHQGCGLHRVGDDQEESIVWEPADDERDTDDEHGFDDVPLDTFRLSL